MKQKTKIILIAVVSVIAIALIAAFLFLVVLGCTWERNHEFGAYVIAEGPWGSENTWVSDDGNSYLVGKMDSEGSDIATVTAYIRDGDDWIAYELNCLDRIVYLDPLAEGESYQGYMKFDGTTFTIHHLQARDTVPETTQYRYTIMDQ